MGEFQRALDAASDRMVQAARQRDCDRPGCVLAAQERHKEAACNLIRHRASWHRGGTCTCDPIFRG